MATSEIIQFRVSSEEKKELQRRSRENGTSISETIRQELALGIKEPTPLEMFERAQKRAQQELIASGLPELTDEAINAYCEAVRQERAQEAMRPYV